MATLTEHSEQAKAAYPDFDPPKHYAIDSHVVNSRLRTAFDRGMAERRITDRETLVRALYEVERGSMNDTEWGILWASASKQDDLPNMQRADAILALPSTPITSTREALAKTIGEAMAVPVGHIQLDALDGVSAHSRFREAVYKTTDALLASGLVKDNGNAPKQAGVAELMALHGLDARGNKLQPEVMLRHPDGSWKTNDEIRDEAASLRELDKLDK